jgi:hypothetical protein
MASTPVGPSWVELLSADEVSQWVSANITPKSLKENYSRPGVYRFIFDTVSDSKGGRTPYYIGEAGDVCKRLKYHFRRERKEKRDENGNVVMRPGWRLNGRILQSGGKFTLEFLQIDGGFSLGELALSQASFESPFVRKLFENWALCSPIQGLNPQPLNCGLAQQVREWRGLLRSIVKRESNNPMGAIEKMKGSA